MKAAIKRFFSVVQNVFCICALTVLAFLTGKKIQSSGTEKALKKYKEKEKELNEKDGSVLINDSAFSDEHERRITREQQEFRNRLRKRLENKQ